jgi:tetratricopeptide (TPR) repeat protein
MSAHLPSRWPSAAALLAAGMLTSAAAAQSSDPLAKPPARPIPRIAPAPVAMPILPARLYVEPQLIEEEQVSEHGDGPHAPPLVLPAPPRVFRGCGMPECDGDDGKRTPEEMALRCLLFTINPLAAFLPLPVEVQAQTLPTPTYLEHQPLYLPLACEEAVPQVGTIKVPEAIAMPQEAERLEVMPIEVEQIDVMPYEEQSEPQYQLLAPWTDYTHWFKLPTFPLAELKVSVKETDTGSLLFGVGAEVNTSGTITVTTEALSPGTPALGEGAVLPPPRALTDVGPRTEVPGAAARVFGQPPIPTPSDLDKYKRYVVTVKDDPTFTFEVIAGQTRLLHLREAPIRIQIGDARIFDHTTLDKPTELLLQGKSVGSTPMLVWFGDRNDPANQTAVAFDINVLPDTHVIPCFAESAARASTPPAPAVRKESVPAVPPQVQVNMMVAEVTAKGARKLNLDRPADGKAPRWFIEVADEARQKALETGLTGLREKGHADLIAEPRMLTLSGQRASILSGGQMAVPVATWLGQSGVRYELFGTEVSCLPTVLPGGTVRLEVESEISELCAVSGGCAKGVLVPGRSSQRVHTTADVPAGHTLVISGPKAGGNARSVLFVTPAVVETPTATGATPVPVPNPVFDFDTAVRGVLRFFGANAYPSNPDRRMKYLMDHSENLRQIDYEMEHFWEATQPSHLTPDRVHGGVGDEAEESVHDLLMKCRREMSRGHYAAAEDLAQRALERDRQQVFADPIVRGSDLMQRVKAIAMLPLGTVEPCAAKGAGGGIMPSGAAKAIGSDERIVEVLLQEFNTAYKEARYRDAAALAERACDLDPDNAMAVAAQQMTRMQSSALHFATSPAAPTPVVTVASLRIDWDNTTADAVSAAALARFQGHFKEGRYEEAKAEALRALAVAPANPVAAAAFQQACEALSGQARPQPVPQCTYVGTSLRPSLPSVDPAVVGALQKLLIQGEKVGPFGGSEEAEPRDDGSKPAPRR